MDNTNVGNGNISKKVGYSITDEQLQNIATQVKEILDTISQAKADKAVSLAGYGILDGLSFVEGYADEIDDYYSTDNAPKLYKIIQESRIMLMKGFVPYYLYAGTIHPLVDGKGTDLYQYKITSNGILFRKGIRNNNANTWASWGLLGSGSSGGAVSSVNEQTGDVNLTLKDISENITADDGGFSYSGAAVDFWMNLSGFSFSTASYNGLSLGLNGLVYSGSPFTNDDIILNQKSWVDENDQSQGVVTTTHKLSRKAESDLSNVSDEVFFAKLNSVLPDGDEVSY